MGTRKLNKQQSEFASYKAQGYSNEESAIRAGYSKSYASVSSHKLLDNCEIKKEIERLTAIKQEVIQKQFSYTIQDSFNKLNELQGLALTPEGDNGRINLQSALKAEELKGKLAGLYIDKVEQTNIDTSPFEVKIVE